MLLIMIFSTVLNLYMTPMYLVIWALFYTWFLQCMPSVLWRCWLGGMNGIRPVKNWVVGCWHGYVSGSRCRFAYGRADATAITVSCSSKSRLVLPSWFYLSAAFFCILCIDCHIDWIVISVAASFYRVSSWLFRIILIIVPQWLEPPCS